MKKLIFIISILLIGLYGFAYIFSNHMLNSALAKLQNIKEFKIDSVNKNSSILSNNLNFRLQYKDFDLDIDMSSSYNPLFIFNGFKINGDIKDLSQDSVNLAKFSLNIPLYGGKIHIQADISPIQIIQHHSSIKFSNISINSIMDSKKLYFIKANLDKAKFEFDNINVDMSGIFSEIEYIDGVDFADFNPYALNPSNLKLLIDNLSSNINFINLTSENIRLSSKINAYSLADIFTDLTAKYIMVNGIAFDDISSKIILKNISTSNYKNFIISKPEIVVDNLTIRDFLELKFDILIDNQSFNGLNLNGEFIAYKPISYIKGLEFISIYEKFLISNGVLIQNGNGYLSKFKSNIQNSEIIFNNSVKFSDILSEF
ncbi:hypothetical protein [Campylobacter porcelli]|uniref:DUF945 domain protein n=1 Tax=Campylobacter porcelli TaxID=1660073 RepID=A0A1X9SX80_9BACT|nr:hypothetical protein [Campylobacter sp. RM6137]ARR00877.1 hypothetical protein CSUIS_1071 [Campylobacter sp. RM6137]